MKAYLVIYTSLVFSLLAAGQGTDQTRPGAGNARAEEIGPRSLLVKQAFASLEANAKAIRDVRLRNATLDGLTNLRTCIAHRANLTTDRKRAVINQLIAAHLLNFEAGPASFPEAVAAVFPPVLDDGGACPHVPLSFAATPGSSFGSHHSYPGGLVLHESFNQLSAKGLAAAYRQTYPVRGSDELDEDVLRAAPVWHDWAKMFVFQWNADGTEFQEMSFGGTGKNDNFGRAGDSRTGAHHILGLAETMARGLSPRLVITQASAHAAPTLGNEYKVINWLRAAAIVAQLDPVAKGFLVRDGDGSLRLPNRRIEYQIHHMSDADYVNAVPAVAMAEKLLRQMAPKFGYVPEDAATYNNRYRNVVLAWLTAERIQLINDKSGPEAVLAEIESLRRRNILQR